MSNMKKLPRLTCKRCGHVWVPRRDAPVKCADKNCGTPYWDQPRRQPKAEKGA